MYRLVAWFDSMPRGIKMVFYMMLIALVLGGQLLCVNLYITKLESKVDSKSVVRVKGNANPIITHTVITADMVEIKPVRLEDVQPNGFVSIDDVVGKEATVPLDPREQITSSKINVALKKEGETTIEFPNAWLISFPQSMRRLDKVRLWVAGDPKDFKNMKVSGNQPNQTPSSTDVIFQMPMQSEINDITKNQEPLLKDLTIAYFKDASSNDVIDATDASAPRVKSSGVGSKIELSFTDQQWAVIRELAMKGYKFVIGY
jgi:hypothetical protein